MIIKVKTTPEQREKIEARLGMYRDKFLYLEEKYKNDIKELEEQIETYKEFWENNEIPVYTLKQPINYNPNTLYEAKSVWKEMGMNITLMKPYGCWVCSCCEQPIRKKYIATGHDHTDYGYDVCDCEGVRGNKRYSELT
jgi:hypothetical protein